MTAIRPAVESDLPGILDIYNDVILTTTAVYDYLPHTPEMRKEWWTTKQKNGYPVFVAPGPGGSIAGFSSYGPFRSWAAYQYTVENSVYVAPEFQGRGIGKLLLSALIENAGEKGFHAMIAGIDSGNAASIHLHRLMGFEEVALFREVGYKFNRWLNLKFFELILPARTPGR